MTDITYSTLRRFMKGGYDSKPPEEIDGYVLDKDISHSTANVYYNSDKNEAIINHRGSQGMFDWLYNASYLYGGENFYKLTPRYYEAEKAQQQTEKKYGNQNTITVGHSAGGLLSELLGKNSKQIITLNKAARPQLFPKSKHKNQLDIRSKCDIVSASGYYDKQIECSSLDILEEHKTDILEKIGDKMVGEGINLSKNNISVNNIMNSFTHLHPNAYRNIKHHLHDDSKFRPLPVQPIMLGNGLIAESKIKNPHHRVMIPELSGRGLIAEGRGMCGSGICPTCGMKGRGLIAENSGSGMCGSGIHTGKGMCTGRGYHTEMKGTGKCMKGSKEMKDKMEKLRNMRKTK